MGYGIGDNIYTISDLKTRTKEICAQAKNNREPIIITVNGHADVLVVDVKLFNERLAVNNLTRLIQEGEDDIAKGNIREAKYFLKDFEKHAKKVQSLYK